MTEQQTIHLSLGHFSLGGIDDVLVSHGGRGNTGAGKAIQNVIMPRSHWLALGGRWGWALVGIDEALGGINHVGGHWFDMAGEAIQKFLVKEQLMGRCVPVFQILPIAAPLQTHEKQCDQCEGKQNDRATDNPSVTRSFFIG